ncbi:hypothetical protein FKM82_008515 [Ascaphus truei]
MKVSPQQNWNISNAKPLHQMYQREKMQLITRGIFFLDTFATGFYPLTLHFRDFDKCPPINSQSKYLHKGHSRIHLLKSPAC